MPARQRAKSAKAWPPALICKHWVFGSLKGPHTSKTLMLQELEALLAAVPADAPAKAYRAAIVEENLLGKRTLTSRKETASRLKALHGLDPNKPLFRVLRQLWAIDPVAQPQLAHSMA